MFNNIFNEDDMIRLQSLLKKNTETITCAESCTGGLLASMITEISGSSSIFKGSIVTYANEIKEQELGVKKDTMIKYGAVSEQVVDQMLDGVLKKFGATYAIAVSGVAGPNGGTKDKPVGTVIIGIASENGYKNVERYLLKGTRKEVQIQTAKIAFKKNFEILLQNT